MGEDKKYHSLNCEIIYNSGSKIYVNIPLLIVPVDFVKEYNNSLPENIKQMNILNYNTIDERHYISFLNIFKTNFKHNPNFKLLFKESMLKSIGDF